MRPTPVERGSAPPGRKGKRKTRLVGLGEAHGPVGARIIYRFRLSVRR